MLILWTIQPYFVYQQLMRNGYFYCDPAKSSMLMDYPGYPSYNERRAYRWMITQMRRRIKGTASPSGYPIWAWYRSCDYCHKRPDFRWARTYDDEVCIELAVPEEETLLSDFETWHFVLNDWYLSPATSQQEWDQYDTWFEHLPTSQQRYVKENSWKRIFDITPRRGEWTQNGGAVQACFWMLKKQQIRKVWRLKKGKRVRVEWDCDKT